MKSTFCTGCDLSFDPKREGEEHWWTETRIKAYCGIIVTCKLDSSRNYCIYTPDQLKIIKKSKYTLRSIEKEIQENWIKYDHWAGKIYFIHSKRLNLIKIGYSERAIETRLKQLSSPKTRPISILGACRGDLRAEKILHNKFKDLREKGEWFKPSIEMLKFIDFICPDGDSLFYRTRY